MTGQTNIYGIVYPTDADLVRDTPTTFSRMASTVENALKAVDDRATPAGSTPVVRTSKALLDSAGGKTQGQTGFVLGSMRTYVWTGSSWIPFTRTYIETGTSITTTSSTGYASVTMNTKQTPDAVFIQSAYYGSDLVSRIAHPVVTSLSSGSFQVRFSRNDDAGQWLTSNAVKFHWLAVFSS